MLHRSSSTPVLKSLVRNPSSPILKSCTQSPEPDMGRWSQKNRPSSVSLKPLSRTSSETDMKQICMLTKKRSLSNFSNSLSSLDLKAMDTTAAVENPSWSSGGLKTFSLGGGGCVGLLEREEEEKMAIGGFGGGNDIFGGRGGGGGSHGDNGSGNMDNYYQKMITEFPNDPLLLGNYARFLKEVGDLVRAEEYCERAILANTREGDVLSMYGDLVWNNHRDASWARYYFHQAIKIAPEDCYVLASYAQFLLEAGEDDDDEEIVRARKHKYLSPKGRVSNTIAAAY